MFLGKEDVALMLVKEGLARLDDYAVGTKELIEAQAEAQRLKKNVGPSFSILLFVALLILGELDLENIRSSSGN